VLDSNADGTTDASTIFVYDGVDSADPLAAQDGVKVPQLALQFDKTGAGDALAANLSHRYLFGPAVDQSLADEQVIDLGTAGNVLYPLGDHLNTVRDVVNSGSVVVAHLVYNSFGKLTSGTNPLLFGFTGRPLDADSGLQYNWQRWYDLSTGRWVNEDPLEADRNLYRYTFNNPVGYTDPTGCTAWGVFVTGTQAAGAVASIIKVGQLLAEGALNETTDYGQSGDWRAKSGQVR